MTAKVFIGTNIYIYALTESQDQVERKTFEEAIPLEDYRIEILISSGISGIFDVKPYLKGSAFKELTDESYFRLVHPAYSSLFQLIPAYFGIALPHEQNFSFDTIIWDIQNA